MYVSGLHSALLLRHYFLKPLLLLLPQLASSTCLSLDYLDGVRHSKHGIRMWDQYSNFPLREERQSPTMPPFSFHTSLFHMSNFDH
jgi:hypothetical protein